LVSQLNINQVINSETSFSGQWRLIFTTALDVLTLGINPLVEVGQIYQNINEDYSEVVNIVELQPKFASLNGIIGSSMVRLNVIAKSSREGDERIRISFSSVKAEGVSLFGNPLDFIPDWARGVQISLPGFGSGFFDTTFVDEDLRISTGSNGALFVLCRSDDL
jgi:hypothetical protein